MSVTRVLLDILIVLVGAKLAAEGAERIGVPAVVGEILAGILIGPSALGLVHGDEVLRVLGELGVILLLLDVGLEMDIGELAAVGRASLLVATVGVVVPMAGGGLAALALGMSGKEALFVGSALTATSVGITARVFGDLKVLATVEARTVLGAAVADDVMGLVILTVVTRLVSAGSVSVLSVAGIVGVAVLFLVGASVIGIRLAPPLFHQITRLSRSSGTLIALSLAFTLALAELANAAKLAPIVGAFVAGLALSRAHAAPRIRRELAPLGHVFIPVFFLQIGIDADIGQFGSPKVLGIAAVLFVIAVLGKLAAAAGLWGSPGDRLLVGLGMIPRGEVGLIFATLGLSQGIIGRDVYASLLLVVLASTLVTPPMLKWRTKRLAVATTPLPVAATTMPPKGWLVVSDHTLGAVIDLAAMPPTTSGLTLALDAALAVADGGQPGRSLIDYLTGLPAGSLAWNKQQLAQFFLLLERNEPRAWRFLLVTGVLERCLPDLATALAHRQQDPLESDPTRAFQWHRLGQVNEAGLGSILHPEWARLAAMVLDATEQTPDTDEPVVLARRIVQRLNLGAAAEQAIAGMVADADLIPAAARRLDGLSEEAVLQLATHLGSLDQARAAWQLALSGDRPDIERFRLHELQRLVEAALAQASLTSRETANIVERRRNGAEALAPESTDRIRSAPRSFVLSQAAADLARQVRLTDNAGPDRPVQVAVTPIGDAEWRVDIAAEDRIGVLARELEAIELIGLEVVDATTVVWPDRHALSTFRVRGTGPLDASALQDAVDAAFERPPNVSPLTDATIEFDNTSSPWHTICTVRAARGGRTLAAITAAAANSGVSVVASRQVADSTDAMRVTWVLELVDDRGALVPNDRQEQMATVARTGKAVPKKRRLSRA